VCGVIGLWRPRRVDDDDGAADRAHAQRLLHRLEHRGPDGRALWHHVADDAVLTLGLARLAIVAPRSDAAVAVDRGATADDDVIAAVTNGELYNHAALRRSLPPAGRHDVDTALVPALFRAFGPAWAARARGMFGAVVATGGQLHLFRDPLGKKPLFYRRRGPGWVVASEQKGLFVDGGPDDIVVVDPRRAARVFARGFLEDDEPLLQGVWQVPPGGHVVLDGNGARVESIVPIDEDLDDRRGRDGFDGDVVRLERLLARAVTRRSRVAVPARVLLSGGMDAAVVLAHADGVDATTLQMPGPRDETPRARRVARRLGRDVDIVAPAPPDVRSLRRVLWHTEVPDVAASWEMGSALLGHAEAMAAADVRVVLSGEGADELFLGYPWLRLDAGVVRGRRHDELVRAWARERMRAPQQRAFVRWRAMHEAKLAVAIDSALPRLLPGIEPAAATTTTVTASVPHRARGLQLEALQRDMHTLPVLHADRLWMAAGVEARLPFLDVDVVRAALRLPASTLLSTRAEKPLVRALFTRALGRPAPPKQGFSGGRRPDDDLVVKLAGDVLRRGTRVVAGPALSRLLQGRSDGRVVELLWRVVVLEECADVLGGGP
jgi:asparagine synthase (glutamine-hydrolysing)